MVILIPDTIPPYEIPKLILRAEDLVKGEEPGRCPGQNEEQTQLFSLSEG